MSSHHFGNMPEAHRKAIAATRTCSICHREVRASMLARHENRHRVEQESKPCHECGVAMQRQSRIGARQWTARRFCSPKCKSMWFGRLKIIPLSESYIIRESGCWEWTRFVDNDGYGQATNTTAHRSVWMELVGPIPDGLHLDHLCRNKVCVNPAHLEPVTPAENNRRSAAARSKCRFGHPLDGRKNSRGHRYCLTCHRDLERRRRDARKAAA